MITGMAANSPTGGIVLEGRGISVTLGERPILHGVDVAVPRGAVVALCGPNGSGKSTLLRTLARLLEPDGGTVRLDGQPMAHLSRRAIARHLAFLPQSPEVPSGVTVRDLVGYGRHPHHGLFASFGEEDHEAVAWAIGVMELDRLRDQPVETLSGGERQRAWIAMALAQKTGVLLLDEPTTFLDIGHQHEVLDLLRDLNRRFGHTVVWVLHDLNQAAAYSDRVVLLKDGRVIADGTPELIMRPETVRTVFGLDAVQVRHPVTGAVVLLPSGAATQASHGRGSGGGA